MDILTPFPLLLDFRIFAPTLLRVAAACVFAYLAYVHYHNRDKIAEIHFPIVGRAEWVVWFAIVVEAATAAALFFGYYTQIAALVGAAVALKNIVWSSMYPSFFMLSRGTAFLLLIITFSLLLTGAGTLAFDLPL